MIVYFDIQNLFKNMNSQFFKNYINLKEDSKKAYQSYLQRIQRCFAALKENHNSHSCKILQAELNAFKDFKNIKNKDKQDIYKYFVQRNVNGFYFLRNNQQIQLKILKITKAPLENYQLDWKDIWQRLIRNEPEPSAIKLYSQLVEFLKNIRHLYNPNNAVEVLDYFVSRHSLYNQNLFLFVSLFVNVSNKTSKEVFKGYFGRLIELYEINQLKASNLLVMFINSIKFKNSQITESIYAELNNIIIYSLTTPNPDKKDAIQQKFNTQTSNIIVKIIGKSNSYSVKLLEQIFQIIKNFIRPFEDSKKPLKFLYQIIGGIAKRIQKQEACKKKIEKLKQKELKKQKRSLAKRQQNELAEQESALTVGQEQPSQLSEVKKQQKEQEEQESSDEQSNQNDSDQEEQGAKIQKLVSMELDIEENSDRVNQNQSKIERLQAILQNHISPEITASLKAFVSEHFESIFYVNSKKIVNRLLQQLFIIFPEFVNKSFDALEKAGNIAQINEEGLISNIKHITKYLFTKQIRKGPDFLENVLRVLNRVKQNRRMTDVWQIVNIIVLKIPLLDEKDLELIPEGDKASFQAEFGRNHDRFYQQYSEIVFQSLKRIFTESEHYDPNTSPSMEKHITDLLTNCYPFFKKRVQKQIQDQAIQNSNKFLFALFQSQSELKPSAQFQQQLKELVDNRNIDNEQNLQLDIHVNIILSSGLSISKLKELIRKYSKKNNYKLLNRCMLSISNFTLTYPAFKTTLAHFQTKPQFVLKQFPTPSFLQQKLKNVYEYTLQLIDQLSNELKEFSNNPLKDQSYDIIISKLYGSNLADFKNLKVEKRKTINQLLQILKSIIQTLFHEMGQYDPVKNAIVQRECPFKRESLLSHPVFAQIINTLTYNQLFLHDHHIMYNLSCIIENEIFFMYRHQVKIQKQVSKKEAIHNQKEELPGQSSLSSLNSIFLAKNRLSHFSILLNKYKDSVSIDWMERQLRILLIAPGNEKSTIINKILVKKTKCINVQAQYLIRLLKNTFESRFYYQKIFSLLSDFNTAGYSYTPEQIVNLIDLHIPLIQSQNIKIRQHSLKSLQKLLKTFTKDNVIGNVERALRKYISRQKLEIIWIVCVIIVLKEPLRDTNLELYLGDIYQYMKQLQKLVISETRIIRRISLFAYSYCFRKAKKAVKRYEEATASSQKYDTPKTISEIFEDGYLRSQHKDLKGISNKSMLKRMQPYTSITKKTKQQHPLFTRIQQESFSFILNNPQLGSVILKQFHTDMAGSVEQVISMMQNKKHDLAEIIMKVLEGCYMYSKLKKLNFDRIQYYFGQRFFRYLFDKDAKSNNFKIFYQTKGFIEEHLANLQPYDNQTLVFIYTIDIFTVYQKHHKQLSPQVREDVQRFLLKVISEIIYKGSGVLYKKLTLIFSKIIDIESLKFIITFFDNLVKSKQKLARVTQLLFTIFQQNYQKFYQITQFILNEKLQINNGYINVLINTIIALPQKFIITQNMIQKFGIIDPQIQLSEKRVSKYKKDFYLLNTHRFNSLLVQRLKDYLDQAIKIEETGEVKQEQTSHIVKSKNQLIKSVYSIVTSSISSYIQSYETEETFRTILDLIQILFRLFEFKMDHFVDFKYFEDTLKNIFSNKYDNISHFEQIVLLIMTNLSKVPVKKQADLIKILANRPANFLFMARDAYKEIVVKMIKLEESSMFYRDLLVGISTLLAYAPFTETEVEDISITLSKNQALLLLQSYVLSTLKIGSKFVTQIIRQSSKDRRNIFCKQILIVRGKKEYLDGEQKYIQWKQIKQYSNPYHYHV